MSTSIPTIGRFAPSPTGCLHAGSLTTAVGSWLMARRNSGKWLLRMDDLDTPRVVPGMADDIQRTLESFSLYWDGSVSWQSQHLEAYEQAFTELKNKNLIYPCYCSRKEILLSSSAPTAAEDAIPYPGTCRDKLRHNSPVRSWRVKTSDQLICFNDLCSGTVCQNIGTLYGDFALKRGDGLFTYQLAVIVDDHISDVNQVVRGSDLLNSTGRQIFVQQLLGIPQPVYIHLPLVTNSDGTKLSKRDNLVSIHNDKWKGNEAYYLTKILEFLGMEPTKDILYSSCEEILQWGISAIDTSRIPKHNSALECAIYKS